MTPCSILPVATVPRPSIVWTPSIGIRNGRSVARTGSGMERSSASSNSPMHRLASGSPGRSSAALALPRTNGVRLAVEPVLGQQVAGLHLDEFDQLGVVHQIDLVDEDDEVGHAHLAGQEDVLPGLRHRPVGGRDQQHRAVHLGRPGDHVLHIIGVAGAVDVGVVPPLGLVLDVAGDDGDGLGGVTHVAALADVLVGLRAWPGPLRAWTARMAAVRVVLPWSMWPMVPTLT